MPSAEQIHTWIQGLNLSIKTSDLSGHESMTEFICMWEL